MLAQYMLMLYEMKTCYLFISIVFLTDHVASKILIGDLVDICDAADPKLNECFLRAANQIMPVLAKGIEEFDIPPLDPLRISKMDVGQNVGPLSIQINLYDTVQRGLSAVVFDSAEVDLAKGTISLNGTIPYYDVKGRYRGKGRILLFPIAGDGKANFTFNNTKILIRLQVDSVNVKGTPHLRLNKFSVAYEYDKVKISLSSLFSENKRLADAARSFLGNNSKEVLSGIEGPLAENYARIFSNVIQKFFHHVPSDQLFLNI